MLTHYVSLDYENGRPLRVRIYDYKGGRFVESALYAKGTGLNLNKIDARCDRIRQIFIAALEGKASILTHDFNETIRFFDLPLDKDAEYEVYDAAAPLPEVEVPRMREGREWQRLLANASVVYRDMEVRGLWHNEIPRNPKWGFTITGRSRCEVFNIQGLPHQDDVLSVVRVPDLPENGRLIHFDWISADFLMVAHMSGDQAMLKSFESSDPYLHLSRELDRPRGECKRLLLENFYGFNTSSEVFEVYPELKRWLLARMLELRKSGRLRTIMDREFVLEQDNHKEHRKVLNYTVQGSTAHMMHATLNKLWRMPHVTLLADLHDGIVLGCPDGAQLQLLKSARGVVGCPAGWNMPFRVSMCRVSDGWHRWVPWLVCRDGKRYDKPEPVADNYDGEEASARELA